MRKNTQHKKQDWKSGSGGRCLPSKDEVALSSNPSTTKKNPYFHSVPIVLAIISSLEMI
jgi:hypothetical protein